MVDDDFQLPVVAGHYFGDRSVPDSRKRSFVTRWGDALRKNLAFVWRQAAPYANDPVATHLVSFKRDADGWWHPGSWRDSRVGYAGGRFAFDVNVVGCRRPCGRSARSTARCARWAAPVSTMRRASRKPRRRGAGRRGI